MLPHTYTRFVLNERPKGVPTQDTLRKEVVRLDLKPGLKQVLAKIVWVSLDPAIRGWMKDQAGYLPVIPLGNVMRALAIGKVVEVGEDCTSQVGDLICGFAGLAEFAVMQETVCEIIRPQAGILPEDYLGALGITGMSAYFGLNDVAKLKAGQTLVVSSAAGAVGSMACQLGKQAGARVVGIAGSDAKCSWLRNEIGCDVALNYKSTTFHADFEKDIGKVDVYFDNVGGSMLGYMLTKINQGATIVMCGGISQINKQDPDPISTYQSLVFNRGKMQGFIVTDYRARWGEGRNHIAAGLADGSLKRKFHVIDGLEKAGEALNYLFSGENTGKLIVKVAPIDD